MGLNKLLTNQTGTYALVLYVEKSRSIAVGKLGVCSFIEGFYVYIGSAFGPGGIRARLKRHWLGNGRQHWHIDYLREIAKPVEAVYLVSEEKLEATWVEKLISVSVEKDMLIEGFGATDSAAPSHLFYYKETPDLISKLD